MKKNRKYMKVKEKGTDRVVRVVDVTDKSDASVALLYGNMKRNLFNDFYIIIEQNSNRQDIEQYLGSILKK